jgi:sterol desaturase/sphingolipid hydroxylase (fatty acid hydroxylase superfamily)
MKPDYIALAIPFFFLLIGIELLIDIKQHRHLYRFNDAITNISLGIGQQVTGIFIKAFIMFGYVYVYESHRLFTIQQNMLSWLLLFIGVDFFYYWFHRMSHEINLLWAAHIVHHQSEDYNFSVALRQSWAQSLFGWIFYLPLAWLGFNPIMFLTISAFNTLYQFWIHTQTINSLGPLEWILNTPSHHRVHHGSNPQYIDKNHGGTLIIWDRLFGTFQKEHEKVVYGITKPIHSWNPVWANIHYWVELMDVATHTKKLKDKIRIFIKQPGWFPKDMGGVQRPAAINFSAYHKYDSGVNKQQSWYVLFQFIIALGLAVLTLFKGSVLQWWQLLSIAVYILLILVICGGMLDRKVWYYHAELIRLSLTLILPFAYIMENWFEVLYFYAILYTAFSSIWFNEATKRSRVKNPSDIHS